VAFGTSHGGNHKGSRELEKELELEKNGGDVGAGIVFAVMATNTQVTSPLIHFYKVKIPEMLVASCLDSVGFDLWHEQSRSNVV